jgi:ABC-type amino acid transport substrate-binding protein
VKLPLRLLRGGRRWLLLLALAVLGLLGWWLAYGRQPATDPTWQRIQEQGELRVALDPSWVPFEFLDPLSGELLGFDVDVARALATCLGARFSPPREVQVEWVLVGFDGLYDVLLSGQADLVISALPFEPERVEDVGYSIAYFNAGLVLVVPDGDTATKTVRDLRGRVVAVEWAYVPEGDDRRRLRDGDLKLIRYEDAWAALEAVQSGAAQAALVDAVTALHFTGQCPGLRIAGEAVTDVNYVIASRPDDIRVREAVDEILLEMRQDGTLRRLRERWF